MKTPRILASLVSLLLTTQALGLGAPGLKSPNQSNHTDLWFTHSSESSPPLPDKNLGNEILYQIVIDRFHNGNSSNDCVYDGLFCDPSKKDWFRFWGGDLRGVIDKMDYLKDLGVSRIWLTPIFDNQMVTVRRHKYGRAAQITAYHGYWIRDWFRLNPYFSDEGKEDFDIVEELVERAGPEIKVLLDTVTNHTSPSDATSWSLSYLQSKEPLDQSDGIRRTHRGALFRAGEYVTSLDEDNQRRSERGYLRTFHEYGPILDYENQFQLENFQLDGLADINQTNPVMYDYMLDAHDFWLTRFPELAGFRMDTIKHVSMSYWRDFNRDIYSKHPEVEIVGEYFGAGPYNAASHEFYKTTHMSMFDFDFRNAVIDIFLKGRSMKALTRLWSRDPDLIDARSLITFLDNHDVARLRGLGVTRKAMRQAIALWFAARGVPCLYYGQEQDLFQPGDPGDPYNRPMMRRFDQGHDFYRLIQRLAELRRENSALRWGSTHVVHLSHHIIGFERILGDQKVFFATSRNPILGSDKFEMQGLTLPDGTYQDMLSGHLYRVRDGKLPVDLRDGDIVLLSSTRTH